MDPNKKNSYKLVYWYIEHKPLFKKIASYIAIGFVVLLWINVIVQSINYILHIKENKEIEADLGKTYVNYEALKTPQSITILETEMIARGDGKYDLFAQINNPNTYWAAKKLTYQFNVNGQTTAVKDTFILPGEDKFLTEINFSSSGIRQEPVLQILDVSWQGIKEKLPKVNFVFSDTDYESTELANDENSIYTRLYTTVANNSTFGFHNVKITALALSQGKPSAVGVVYINDFFSNQTRDIDFSWPKRFAINSEIQFNVETNVLSDHNLITVTGLEN